jgi:hypothetical protein
MVLANARLSERSARLHAAAALTRRLRAWRGWQRRRADAARLTALAHAVAVVGNLSSNHSRRHFARRCWRGAGVTSGAARPAREGEEAVLLRAFADTAPAEVLLVLVPRHPQRFDAVAGLIEAAGLPYQRRSALDGELKPETRVLLGDSLGELFAYYAACDVAFVGGSLMPLGGQNLIEAASVGRPVLVGAYLQFLPCDTGRSRGRGSVAGEKCVRTVAARFACCGTRLHARPWAKLRVPSPVASRCHAAYAHVYRAVAGSTLIAHRTTDGENELHIRIMAAWSCSFSARCLPAWPGRTVHHRSNGGKADIGVVLLHGHGGTADGNVVVAADADVQYRVRLSHAVAGFAAGDGCLPGRNSPPPMRRATRKWKN